MSTNSDGRIGPVTNLKAEWELSSLNDREIILTCAVFHGVVINRHIQPDIRSVLISKNG